MWSLQWSICNLFAKLVRKKTRRMWLQYRYLSCREKLKSLEERKCAEEGGVNPLGILMIQENMNKAMSVKQHKENMRVVSLNQGRSSWRWVTFGAKYSERLKTMKNKTLNLISIIREYKEIKNASPNQYFNTSSRERKSTLQKWYLRYTDYHYILQLLRKDKG